MPLKVPAHKDPFRRLVAVMVALRKKQGGCPWDKAQTSKSIRPYLVEETYEVLEAIDANDPAKLRGELGDLLLQVVFHAQIAADKKQFGIDDVAAGIADKMVSRHPHVFGDGKQLKSAADRVHAWESLKAKEKEHQGRKSIVDGVPIAMPALYRSRRVLSKAARARFTWRGKGRAWAKFEEELKEFRQASKTEVKARRFEELGDLLLSLVNVARFEKLDPEAALHAATRKLAGRIAKVEEKAAADGTKITKLGEQKLLAYWAAVKADEGKSKRPSPKKRGR